MTHQRAKRTAEGFAHVFSALSVVPTAMSREEIRRRALKRPDSWWVVLVIDPIALRLLPFLLRFPKVTPVRVTGFAAALGIGSVASFASGHLVLGAALFELRFFFDCIDGKLARVLGLTSDRGAFLDLASDIVLINTCIGALAWHLAPTARGAGGADVVPLALAGPCLLAGFVLYWLILWDLSHAVSPTEVPSHQQQSWLRRHGLHRLPRTVEVETFLLFIAPLTGSTAVLRGAFAVALAYFALASVNLATRIYRTSLPSQPADGGGVATTGST
ncbi:MAG: CDP-alcohol phosphatidyltransferase family protein [Marmoricola sp.]